MVTLGDPMSESFADFVARCRERPLIRGIRIRLVPELSGQARGRDALDDRLLAESLELLARSGLVATVEATSRQLGTVTRLAADFPALKIVIDHFGWPEVGRRGGDLASHMHRLASLAELPNVATRIDAIGTIFGAWSVAQIRPWLMDVTTVFGPQRCMLGSDLPVESLRSDFGVLYAAYDEIFAGFSDDDRTWLFHRAAEHWYA
jgi:predicted TIM-barrel fold metal-dependent hydrolase